MRALVVDDEKLARERLARMVSTLDGYEVIGEAANGNEAVQMAAEYDPDIVLLDINYILLRSTNKHRRAAESQ